MTRLLVIDDDAPSRRLVQAAFVGEALHVAAVPDAQSGLAEVQRERPDVVLLDLELPDLGGFDVLERLKAEVPGLPVIMLTANREVRTAVRATQLGAFDYLTKPIDPDELVTVVHRALAMVALQHEVALLRRQLGEGGGLALQMGPGATIAHVIEQVRMVATSSFTVLVVGETGTGKELISQAIHRDSNRHQRPFVALDCGAIPEQLLESELFGHERGAFTGADRKKRGHFEMAEGGTLFLDEVGNLPMTLQAKLLRVLESRQVQPVGGATTNLDVRFVAATNLDLQARVAAGQFRADLYFRLAQYTVTVPPLRQRSEDIPYLAGRFLEEASVELRRPVHQIMPDALELLSRHAWPGNVRELRNVIRQAVLGAKDLVIRRDVVRALLGKPGATPASAKVRDDSRSLREIAGEAAEAAERQAICDTLRVTRGNKSQAARALRTDYKTLHLKMKHLGIRGRDFAP